MIVFCDGSNRPRINSTEISYGVRVHHNGQAHELSGYYETSRKCVGMHEVVAFIEAMLFVESHGVKVEDVSFYTDDQFISTASFYMTPENLTPIHEHGIFKRLDALTEIYSNFSDIKPRLIQWLKTARIHAVKGHRRCVDHNRVDHLANSALNNKSPVDYEQFVASGFVVYEKNGASRWVPPFASRNVFEVV